MHELTCASLFSGVGGIDIGLSRAGFRHLLFAEVDPYCRAVLAQRFPGVTVFDDVRAVTGEAYRAEHDRPPDLLAGGFPCQDLSVAGKRAGLKGDRSGLFWEFMRVADELCPRAVLIENVEGLYSSGSPRGSDFGALLDALAQRGYLATWRTLDAQHFGVPQRRRRVFVCAIAERDPAAADIGAIFALTEGSGRDLAQGQPTQSQVAGGSRGGAAHGGGAEPVTGAERERERQRESHPGGHRQMGKGQRRPSRRRMPEPHLVAWWERSARADFSSTRIRNSWDRGIW